MSYLIDDVARTLADPMPRRKAFRYLAGVLAGVFMATIGAQRASAATCAKNGDCMGANMCCLNGTCVSTTGNAICGGSQNGICCSGGFVCCSKGNVRSCCGSGTCCCTSGVCLSSPNNGTGNPCLTTC